MLATFHQLIGLRGRPPGGSGADGRRPVIGWGRRDFQWFVNFYQPEAVFLSACLHLKYTMVHDGNKDEAEKCFNLAQKYFKEGNRDKAAWFAQKAERLYPSQKSQGKKSLVRDTWPLWLLGLIHYFPAIFPGMWPGGMVAASGILTIRSIQASEDF